MANTIFFTIFMVNKSSKALSNFCSANDIASVRPNPKRWQIQPSRKISSARPYLHYDIGVYRSAHSAISNGHDLTKARLIRTKAVVAYTQFYANVSLLRQNLVLPLPFTQARFNLTQMPHQTLGGAFSNRRANFSGADRWPNRPPNRPSKRAEPPLRNSRVKRPPQTSNRARRCFAIGHPSKHPKFALNAS